MAIRAGAGASAALVAAFIEDLIETARRLAARSPGARLDRDRPTRQTTWPGEDPQPSHDEHVITDRDADFVQYVLDQVNERQQAEDAFYAGLDDVI